MAEKQATIVTRGEGTLTHGQAGEIAFKICAADSNGAYSAWEYPVRPGGTSSPHYHLKIYESWY